MTAVEWPARGLCADDPDAWVIGEHSGRPRNTEFVTRRDAVQACRRCPALDACVRYTLDQPDLPSECVQAGKVWPVLLREREAIAAELMGQHGITTDRDYRNRRAVKPAPTSGYKARVCRHCGELCWPRRGADRRWVDVPEGAKRFEAKGLCRECYSEGRIPRVRGRGSRPGPRQRTGMRLVIVAQVLEEGLTPKERDAKLCQMFNISRSTAQRYVQMVNDGGLRKVK